MFIAFVALACVLAGAVVTGVLPVPKVLQLPASAFLAILLILAASPVLVRSWQLTLGMLLVWLVFEDLLRKLAGNDIRVYFTKDLIYLLLLISLMRDRRVRGAWREATGLSRLPLYAVLGWAVVMAVPVAFTDWRLPLIGLRVDFFYAPLVVAGFLLARESTQLLARALTLIALVGAVACAIGLVQAILGPTFLAPSEPTPGLINLVLLRALGTVYRPTGTFVDPGRFASMAVIAVGVSTAAFILTTGRARAVALITLFVSTIAVWLSGGRGTLLQAAFLIILAVVPVVLSRHRRSLTVAAVVVLATVMVTTTAAFLFPRLVSSRFAWYLSTLNPLSDLSEWAFRWNVFSTNLQRGLTLGGWFGMGTGQESLGKQYLYGGSQYSTAGLYHIEGGYAAVEVEWGLVGLLLWLLWTVTWVRRQLRVVWALRNEPLGHAGLVLLGWIVIFLFLGFVAGFQEFQNYLGNAYFWLISGIVFGLPLARFRHADGKPHPEERQNQ